MVLLYLFLLRFYNVYPIYLLYFITQSSRLCFSVLDRRVNFSSKTPPFPLCVSGPASLMIHLQLHVKRRKFTISKRGLAVKFVRLT